MTDFQEDPRRICRTTPTNTAAIAEVFTAKTLKPKKRTNMHQELEEFKNRNLYYHMKALWFPHSK